MAYWHVCRTFTGSVKERKYVYLRGIKGMRIMGLSGFPTYPHYHYIMSSIPTECGSLENFANFLSYPLIYLIGIAFYRIYCIT